MNSKTIVDNIFEAPSRGDLRQANYQALRANKGHATAKRAPAAYGDFGDRSPPEGYFGADDHVHQSSGFKKIIGEIRQMGADDIEEIIKELEDVMRRSCSHSSANGGCEPAFDSCRDHLRMALEALRTRTGN